MEQQRDLRTEEDIQDEVALVEKPKLHILEYKTLLGYITIWKVRSRCNFNYGEASPKKKTEDWESYFVSSL